jgi:5-methylcytosine-specific restriction protein A
VFEQLSDQIDEIVGRLAVPRSFDAVVRVLGLAERLVALAQEATGDLDADKAWQVEGATSMTASLKDRARQSGRDAGRCARTGRRLRVLPVTAAAAREGVLSAGQIDAITANLDDETTPLFAEAEAGMVPRLVPLSAADVGRVMAAWAQATKDALQDDQPDEDRLPERSLHHSRTLGERGVLSGSLDPEANAIVDCALRVATTGDVEGEPARTPAHKRADALVEICRFFLDHQTTALGGRHRPHLNVFVDYEELMAKAGGGGWLADGTRLDGPTIQRLACDAGSTGSSPRADRAFSTTGTSTNQSRRTCSTPSWPATGVAGSRGVIGPRSGPKPITSFIGSKHHGPTAIGNLVLLCTRHHHLLHLPGWHIKLLPDATVDVTRPDGQVLVDRPPGRLDRLFVTDTG